MEWTIGGDRSVKTVYYGNQEIENAEDKPLAITLGTNADIKLNPVCVQDITDSGWYECMTPMKGTQLGLYRTNQLVGSHFQA